MINIPMPLNGEIMNASRPLDLTKPVQTRDGREVRIYATDGRKPHTLHGAMNEDGEWVLASWFPDGIWCSGGGDSRDLINVPAKRKGWEALYRLPDKDDTQAAKICEEAVMQPSFVYDTEEAAARYNPNAIAIIAIEWEEP